MSNINLNTYQRWRRTYYKRKDVRVYTNSILILASFSILVLLAIQPTIKTIFSLRQKIKANQELVERMDRKIKLLNKLEDAYLEVIDYLPVVKDVFPQEISGAYLGRIIKVYAYKHNLKLNSLSLSGYKWPFKAKAKDKKGQIRFNASVVLSGDYQDIIEFMKEIESLRLVIKIDSVNLKAFKNEAVLTANISLKGYNDQI